jgi:hypothetical protein
VIAHLPPDRAYEDDRVVEEAEVWLKTEKAFTAWCENEEAKERPKKELTFENFARETGSSNH